MLIQCTYLIPGVGNDVCVTEKVGDGAVVGMKETLPCNGDDTEARDDVDERCEIVMFPPASLLIALPIPGNWTWIA